MTMVLAAVARQSGLSEALLLAPGQARRLAQVRQLAMYLLRELCAGATLPAIGHFLGRDHSTVLHGCRRARTRLAQDAAFRGLYERVRRELARG